MNSVKCAFCITHKAHAIYVTSKANPVKYILSRLVLNGQLEK